MKAIQVKYLPATYFKPSRIKAWIEGGESVTKSFSHALTEYNNICECAYSLALKLDWEGKWVGGGLPNGDYAFVNSGVDCALVVV